ncbi:MAG TPA: SAV_6107 family HEPN domain-containing protein [Desulfatiglandales bacterium]|nr:SAV_6107 family HEPN domain-containing protein [Desulfatiglandales bacterium]
MSLEVWKQNGWLREHRTSAQEVASIIALIERDLTDAAREQISVDWRFNIAYNAGLQLAALVLYVSGYRAGRGESKHYRVIQALPLVMGPHFSHMRDYLDNCRRKRNVSEYDAVGTVSEKEAEDILQAVRRFKVDVESWLKEQHPEIHYRQ